MKWIDIYFLTLPLYSLVGTKYAFKSNFLERRVACREMVD